MNQLTAIADPLAGQTDFTYDGNGNPLTVTDARSNATTYTYNNMDRVSTRTDPLTHQESSTYDNNGNPATHTDRNSQVTSRTYDALDRLAVVTFADTSTIAYTYDAGHRVTQLVDSLNGTITRSYNGLDRLTQEVTPQGTVSYTYDAANRRSTMTVTGQATVSYTYDTAGRLTQIQQGSDMVTQAYDNTGRRTSLTLPNGVTTTSTYDAASHLTGLTYTLGATPLGTLSYAYDANGSRIQLGGTWARTGIPTAMSGATYNAANQQSAFNGQAQTFDLNGNLTSDGTTTYTWNARDQLVGLTRTGLTAAFAYDGTGRRQSTTMNGTPTTFLYDGLNAVQETDPAGSTTLLAGLEIDAQLFRTDASGSVALLTDALGSTLGLADATGAVTTSYTYDPFGATTAAGVSSANRTQYTGRENDGTGLYYYRARYYHPGLQRFISDDPIGFRGGDWNLYAYVRNSPGQYRDPLGLCVTDDPADCFPPPAVPVDSPRPIGGRKDAPLLCGPVQDRPIPVGLTAVGLVTGPGELGRCLDACAAGGEAWRRYCNSLSAYPPGLKRGCWAVALMGEVACRGYCFRYWGK